MVPHGTVGSTLYNRGMSNTSAFELPISQDEFGAFLGGLLVGLIQSEITAIQHDVSHAMGRAPTDDEWEKMKERTYRQAFERVLRYFPETIRSRLQSVETDMIASVMRLN